MKEKQKPLGERIKSFIGGIVTGVLSNMISQWVFTIVTTGVGIFGLKKIFNIRADIMDNRNVSSQDKVLLIFCSVICGISLFVSICAYIYVHRRQKAKQKELALQETSLGDEKEKLEAEKEKLKADNMVPAFPPLDTRYTIQNLEFELYFKDRENIIQRHTVEYIVADKPLKTISHTMHWTGSGYLGSRLLPKSLNKGYTLEEESCGLGLHNINIVFPEEKMMGFSDKYSFESEISDEAHQMQPVLARIIKCRTNHLTLKVTVPKGMIKSCEKYVSADIPCEFILNGPEVVQAESVGDNDCYRFPVDNPELLRFYGLRWNFEN